MHADIHVIGIALLHMDIDIVYCVVSLHTDIIL